MSIEICASATIKHINVRKEGPEDEKMTAFDLKLSGRVPAQLVDQLMCPDEESGRALAAFWDEDGIKRHMSLEGVGFYRRIEHAETEICGITLKDCTVKSFSFVIKDGFQADLTWSVSSKDWPSNTLAILAEQLHEAVQVRIFSTQGDLFEQAGELVNAADKLVQMGSKDGGIAISGRDGRVIATFGDSLSGEDELFATAWQIVRESGRPSISFIQRKLVIGYNRAARLVEAMQAAGLVTPMGPNGQRSVISAERQAGAA